MQQESSAYPVVRLFASLTLMTIGGSGMYAMVVSLKPVAIEFGTGRGADTITSGLEGAWTAAPTRWVRSCRCGPTRRFW